MEFISLSNLITMGVVVLILVLYRYLDKNNRSLEKVKRFTDKVKDSLSGFIEEKTQEIRNLSIDMQVNLKTAKEILKRIGDIEVELKNKAKSMDTLQSKVNEYDTLIRELNSATITVEENLKRIHNESAFIDKVGKRVQTAQTKLEQIEKDIPLIRDEFKKNNYEDLEDMRNALTEDMTQRVKIIQEEVQGAETRVKDFSIYLTHLEGRKEGIEKDLVKKLDIQCRDFETGMLQKKVQVINSFKEELSGYLTEVNVKRDEFRHSMDELVQGSRIEISDLEDMMVKNLIENKKDIEQAELNFKQNISKVVAAGKDLEHDIFTELKEKIKQDTQKVHGEVEKQLVQFKREVEVRNNEIAAILGKTGQNTEVWKTAIVKRIEKLKNELNTHFVNSKAEIEVNLSDFIRKNEDTQKVFESQFLEFVKKSKNGMQVLDIEFSKKIEELNQGFSVFKNDYTRKLKEVDDKADEEKEQILVSLDEKMKNVEKQCSLRFEQVKNDVDKINGLGEDIEFRMKNIRKDIQECSCDLLGRIGDFRNKFSDDLTIASSEVEKVVMNNIDQRLIEYETDANYRFEKLERVQTDIELLEKGLREFMEAKKEDLKEDFNEFIGQLGERKNEEREHTNEVLKEIRTEIQKLDDEVHGLKAKAYENLSEKLKIFEDEFFVDLKKRNEAMTGSLNEWQASVKEKMDSLDTQHEKEMCKIEKQYHGELQAGISALEEKAKAMLSTFEQKWHDTLSAGIDASKEQVNLVTGEYKEEMKNIIQEIENNFTSQRDHISTGFEKYREEVKKIIMETENNLVSQRGKINTDIEKYMEGVGKMITETENNFISQYDKVNSDIKKYREEVKEMMTEMENNFVSQRGKVITDIEKYKEEVKKIIIETENYLVSQRGEINTDIEKCREEAAKVITETENNFISQYDKVNSDIKKHREEIKEMMTEMENNFVSQRGKVNTDIEKYKEEVKKIIIETENNFVSQRGEIYTDIEKCRDEAAKVITETENNLITQYDKVNMDIKKYREEAKKVMMEMENNLLSQRGKAETDIEKYKEDIRNTILKIKNEFNSQKKDLDTDIGKYREEVKNIISEVINAFTSQRDSVSIDIENYREEVKNIIQGMESDFTTRRENISLNMEKYKEEVKGTIREIEADFTSQRDSVSLDIEKYKEEVRGMIREIQNNFTSQRDDLVVETEEERKTLKAEIESCGQKLSASEKRFTEQTNAVLNSFQSEYKQKQDEFTGRLRELQGEFELKIKEFKTSITDGSVLVSNTQKEQKNEIKILDDKIRILGKQLKEMAEKAITSCNDEYQKLKEDFLNQSRVFGENIGKKISGFENTFRLDQEKIKLVHSRLSGKIEEQYKSLADNLKKIERQQQGFTAQTKLFERADSLKLALKNELEDLRKDMKLLEPAHKKMKTLETELIRMNKLAEDLNMKSSKYNAEKRRIDSMENNFKQLLKISDTIDEKLAGATASYDSLQDIKIKIRELGDLSNDVHARYERLEKKKEVIETTTLGVDKNFKLLEDLEKEIKRIEENVESLPPQVLSIGEEIKFLVKNKSQADQAVEQMNALNKMLTDIEERTQKLSSARDWLARTETRLESIGKSAQDQLKLLKALIKEDGGNGKNSKGAPQQDKREMIVKLARQGWSPVEISKATNTSVGEVELILELEPQKR